jgi:integrase
MVEAVDRPRDHLRAKRDRCTLVVAGWPERDRELWDRANRPGSMLRPGGMAANLAPASKRNMTRAYGAWLFWLAATGSLGTEPPPEDRFTEDNLLAYVAHLQDHLSEMSVAMHIDKLHQAARAMMSKADLSMLATLARNLNRDATPGNTKATRLVHARALFEFGLRLMTVADEAQTFSPARRAVLFRDALLIAFLAARPQRKRNVEAMELGTTLVRENDRYWLHFAARATKNKRRIDVPCPDALTTFFDKYFAVHWPVLRNRDNAAASTASGSVWVSLTGAPMGDMAIYRATRRRILHEFGKAVNPHLFRDCAATTIALDDPICIQIVMHVLGHTRLAASERHYNQARGFEAGRSLIALIEAQRSEATDRSRCRRTCMPEFPHKRLGKTIDRTERWR